ncbi:Arabinanase/levansucrase/invertase [Anaeromyces robustus]|uniref:Arabinanase/levansucrase/invertase n=1 Tax=Anaeromyces robustus TaxID=1754192 RepID=A0A1Y1WPC1_9FUNG|nr:Arabinanase/levansucrase/invertase [Anaeromyces robustus]|eukprot:ORX75387.1 Arabinanase/levansucrase/invertase [Anaeromyces robustus]
MKFLTALSLLFASYGVANAYNNCTHTCRVLVTEDGVEWGAENNDWCIIDQSLCVKEEDKNQCFSFPNYLCCNECNVVLEDEEGKWGYENNRWCGIKDTCTKQAEPEPKPEKKEFCAKHIITSMYTADPAPLIVDDTLYIYTTHDEDVLINNFYTMRDWYVFSTKDMVNWTNHGPILSLDDITWADDRAWAPQTIERNGKYYFYYPAHKIDGGMAVGVAIGDSPVGPFKDIGEPLVYQDDWIDFDPTVFIDDDGQAYLYFGNPQLRYVLLNEDMVSYNEEVGIVDVELTVEGFGEGNNNPTSYDEGPFFYKRNGIYYMLFSGFRKGYESEYIGYATSTSPTGPWKYGGILMEEHEDKTFTNHSSIVEFNGHTYFFFHTGDLPDGGDFHRSVAYIEFEYNEDGSINPITNNLGKC